MSDEQGKGNQLKQEGELHKVDTDAIESVIKEMQVGTDSTEDDRGMQSQERKDRVSFGTNMTPDEELSDGGSVLQTDLVLASVVDRFHARKFGVPTNRKQEKRVTLKATSNGKTKKQKMPVKANVQGVMEQLSQEGEAANMFQPKSKHMEIMEMGKAGESDASKLDHVNLTGARDETR
jgi:hypothetical protein